MSKRNGVARLPIPQTIERFEFPKDGRYAGHWVDLWVDPPDRLITEMTATEADKDKHKVGEVLPWVIKDWSFADPQQPEERLPLTAQGVSELSGPAITTIWIEFWRRYNAPLVTLTSNASSPTDGATPTPSLTGSPS